MVNGKGLGSLISGENAPVDLAAFSASRGAVLSSAFEKMEQTVVA